MADSLRLHRILVPLLLIFGVEGWLNLGHGNYGLTFQLKGLLIALVASAIPPINRVVVAGFDRLRRIQPSTLRWIALAVAVLSTLYFPYTAYEQGRNFQPKWQDELSYRIQFQQLAHGHLWHREHPCADFFDTFQVLVHPVYASMYFPGPSLLYALTLLAHLPLWTMSVLISGLAVAVIFLVVTDLTDVIGGLLAVLMTIGNELFRRLSIMTFGYPLILLLSISAVWSWLRWRKTQHLRWAILIGACCGFAAITRPMDAVIVAAVIGIDLLLSLRQRTRQQNLKLFGSIILGALPFLTLQVVFDLGVTGKPFLTPFDLYAQRDYPGTTIGFHTYDPTRRPVSIIPQKQAFHDTWTLPAIRNHTPGNVLRDWAPERLRMILDNLLPHVMFIILLPVGLLGLRTRPRVLIWLMLPMFAITYSFYTFFFPHYAATVMPAVMLTAILSIEQCSTVWQPAARFAQMFLVSAIALMSLTETAEFNRYERDEIFVTNHSAVDDALAKLEHRPAVVLFHYSSTDSPHDEPVYNIDVPWPDDAPIVRAHDLGPRNIEIFRYYAEHQPNRAFYLYNRADGSVRFLGFAPELAKGGV